METLGSSPRPRASWLLPSPARLSSSLRAMIMPGGAHASGGSSFRSVTPWRSVSSFSTPPYCVSFTGNKVHSSTHVDTRMRTSCHPRRDAPPDAGPSARPPRLLPGRKATRPAAALPGVLGFHSLSVPSSRPEPPRTRTFASLEPHVSGWAGPRAGGGGACPDRAGAAADADLGPAAFRATPRTASRSSGVSTRARGSSGAHPHGAPSNLADLSQCAPALVLSPSLPLPAQGPAEDKRPPVSWARTL